MALLRKTFAPVLGLVLSGPLVLGCGADQAVDGAPPKVESSAAVTTALASTAPASGPFEQESTGPDAEAVRPQRFPTPRKSIRPDDRMGSRARYRCRPTAGPPIWVEEGQYVEARIRCAKGISHAPGEFSIANLPDGARFDSANATLTWTPRLDQAAVYELQIISNTYQEQGTLKIGVADAFDTPGNVPIRSATSYTEELGIPVLHLESSSSLPQEGYAPATIVYRGKVYAAEAKFRGRSSRKYPKRSFTLKFPNANRFSDPEKDFLDRKKVVLITNFNDNSSLRHRLGFDLWNWMDPGHIPVKTFSVALFWNGRYHGLYTLGDHIDKHFIAGLGLPEGGNIYKAVDSAGQFSQPGGDGSRHSGYEKKAGSPAEGEPGAFADLGLLIEAISSRGSNFASEFRRLTEAEEFFDWWIFSTYVVGHDLVRKNYYLYRSPGGTFRYIPWDLDGIFGQAYDTRREDFDRTSDFSNRNLLFDRFLETRSMQEEIAERYAQLLAGPLRPERIQARLDELKAELALAAPRDERRWGIAYQTYWARTDLNSWAAEVAYIRDWIARRHAFQSERFGRGAGSWD